MDVMCGEKLANTIEKYFTERGHPTLNRRTLRKDLSKMRKGVKFVVITK